MTRTRQVILVIVIVFIAYAIYTSPVATADAVHNIWNIILTALHRIFTFFDQLIKG